MKKMGLNELRDSFLKFFESKGHLVLPSASLVPQTDKSLLLINSGMAPLKPYFTGQETPPRRRVATCQKCIRTPDIERVGKTARHGTFFEMLGNFSFGDYFKKEAIAWGWEYVTHVLNLPIDKLWITIYKDDDEAFDIWTKDIGVAPERVVRMGKEDNFWEIGVGPCGPSSEIFFDRGPDKGCGEGDCAIGCECDRYVEFWNLVFTQFNRDEEGNYHSLDHPNIDTGMGLERIAAIMQGVDSLFEVDTIKNIMEEVSHISKVPYGKSDEYDISLRIITDHIRSTVFMISDGILPTNEGRGYVLRRILRRAARHGKLLGIEDIFLSQVAKVVIEESKDAYPELKEREEYILKVIQVEEERFNETIDQGISILDRYIEDMKAENKGELDGERAFRLYDTYGFPLELTKEILEEEGLKVDEEGFNHQMKAQRERARAARHETDYMGSEDPISGLLESVEPTEFLGYETLENESRVLAIIKDNKRVSSAKEGDKVILVLDRTPFYPESGGQVGDIGVIENRGVRIEIVDTSKAYGDHIIHEGQIISGVVNIDDRVNALVDRDKRLWTARNHSVTHLLHKALREELGSHVEQAGSLVTPKRLRFDFSHFAALTEDEISNIEDRVNQKIMEALTIETIETDFDRAKEMGAMALFGEKYGDDVRVVRMGDYSTELCGGTHLKNTGQVGLFKITSETGIAAGVRRIEALTGVGAQNWVKGLDDLIHEVSDTLKTKPTDLAQKAQGLMDQIKEYEGEIQGLKRQLARGTVDGLLDQVETVGDITFIAARVDHQDMNSLRDMTDTLRDRMGSGVVVLASEYQGRVNLIAGATKDLTKKGIHSGKLIKEIAGKIGGGGGGRPDMAQAGGKEPSGISEALKAAKVVLEKQVGMG